VAEISKTADLALTVLLTISENGPRTPAQLAQELHLNRTVVHRLVNTLHQRGFLLRQEDGYVPGTVLVRCAEHVQPALRAKGRSVMGRLSEAIGETVVLEIRDGEDAVVLEQVVSGRHIVRVEHKIGSRHPLVAGASARAILAFLARPTIDKIVGRAQHPETVIRQLEAVRQLGYSLSHDELQQGVHGLAAPVLDDAGHAIAGMAVLVPTTRAHDLPHHVDALVEAAAALSASMHGA
jgi:IclR family KDG regulon transcriptional repressor